MLPTKLYIIPFSGDGKLPGMEISGFDPPPGIGSTVIAVPEIEGKALRAIEWIYTVTDVEPNDDSDWPWSLILKAKKVKMPRRWFDIATEVSNQGLKEVFASHGNGERINHQPTIQLIYEMLGEA